MRIWLLTLGLLSVATSFAQDAHQDTGHAAQAQVHGQQGHSAYSGAQSRVIKSLSEQQTADLRAGKGMSLALPAELNGYPGPSHALELAGPLGLTAEQKLKIQNVFEQMQVEAKTLGEELISREYELDRLFKDKQASPASVHEATAKAASVQGQLRAAHLRSHLKMAEVLTPAQVVKYDQLRGYQ
jgi:Spy/CpxP family protein refolding chaperone